MKPEGSPEPFRAAITPSQRLLETLNERGVIIEGISVGFLGKPQFTADVDVVFLLSVNDIPQSLEHAWAEVIIPPIHDAAYFARKNRVLLLKHSRTDLIPLVKT